MRKPSILAVALLALAGASQLGCRACQSCHDYGSPVSGAACGGCQGCRSGSCVSSGGYTAENVARGGVTSESDTVLR